MKFSLKISQGKDLDNQRLVTRVVICSLLSAVAFNLWHLFPETAGGTVPWNDRVGHLILIDSAFTAITHGNDITDPWHSTISLGFPLFHHYQHFPHLFVAGIHVLAFKIIPVSVLMGWLTYLLILSLIHI